MSRTVSIILDEVRNQDGDVIATKELVNEVINNGKTIECVTREITKLAQGRVLIDHVIHHSTSNAQNRVERFNFLTGFAE